MKLSCRAPGGPRSCSLMLASACGAGPLRLSLANYHAISREPRMKTKAKSYMISALVAAAALSSASAQAQWMKTSDELGFYVGGGVAGAKVDKLCSDIGLMTVTGC